MTLKFFFFSFGLFLASITGTSATNYRRPGSLFQWVPGTNVASTNPVQNPVPSHGILVWNQQQPIPPEARPAPAPAPSNQFVIAVPRSRPNRVDSFDVTHRTFVGEAPAPVDNSRKIFVDPTQHDNYHHMLAHSASYVSQDEARQLREQQTPRFIPTYFRYSPPSRQHPQGVEWIDWRLAN